MSDDLVLPYASGSISLTGVLQADDFPRANVSYNPWCRPLLCSADPDTFWLAALPLLNAYAAAALDAASKLLGGDPGQVDEAETFEFQRNNPDQLKLLYDDLDRHKHDPVIAMIVETALGDIARILRRLSVRDVAELARLDRALLRQTRVLVRRTEQDDVDVLADELVAAAEHLRQTVEQARLYDSAEARCWWYSSDEGEEWTPSNTGHSHRRWRRITAGALEVKVSVRPNSSGPGLLWPTRWLSDGGD